MTQEGALFPLGLHQPSVVLGDAIGWRGKLGSDPLWSVDVFHKSSGADPRVLSSQAVRNSVILAKALHPHIHPPSTLSELPRKHGLFVPFLSLAPCSIYVHF